MSPSSPAAFRRVGGDNQIVGVVAGVNRRKQMLAPVLDPAHRMLDLQRDRRNSNVLRHDAIFSAKAAADVGSNDANLLFRKPEHPGQREPLDLAALRRQIHHELVEPIVPVSEHAAAFERNGRLAVEPQLAAEPDRRRGQDSGFPSDTVVLM
jgi:hypothetical protein